MDRLFARTDDGIELALHRIAAAGERRAVCLATHAMMTSSRYLARGPENGFAGHLARAGIETFLLDFRGHGDSQPRPARGHPGWCFDDYVERDLPAAVAAVCENAAITPAELVYAGHSLGGLVGLAALGTGTVAMFGAVTLWATSVWLPGAHGLRWRRRAMALYALSSWPLGHAPVRWFGLGSDDEPRSYVTQLASWARTGTWTSREGTNYLARLGQISAPVWGACGVADRLCRPDDAEVLLRRIPGCAPVRKVGRALGDPVDSDHFKLLTHPGMTGLWDEMIAFSLSHV